MAILSGFGLDVGAGAIFFGGGGCVSLPVFSASELIEIFGEGGRRHVDAFFMEFFGYFWVSELHFFIRPRVGGRAQTASFMVLFLACFCGGAVP